MAEVERVEGRLCKQGHFMKTWKTRNFRLSVPTAALDYYDDSKKQRVTEARPDSLLSATHYTSTPFRELMITLPSPLTFLFLKI